MTTLSYKEYKEQSLRDEYVNEALDFIDSESLNEEAVSAGVILLGALGLMAGKKLVQKYKDWKENQKSALELQDEIEILQYKMEGLITKKRYTEAQEVQDEIEKKMQKHKEVLVKGDKEKQKISKLHRKAVSNANVQLAKLDMQKDLIKIKKKVSAAEEDTALKQKKAYLSDLQRKKDLERELKKIQRDIDAMEVLNAEDDIQDNLERKKAEKATNIRAEKIRFKQQQMRQNITNMDDKEADKYFNDVRVNFTSSKDDDDFNGGESRVHIETGDEIEH